MVPVSPQRTLTVVATMLAFASALPAQAPGADPDAFLVGNYQGTMAITPTPRRIIVRVFEGPDHRMAAYLVQLDQGGMDDRQIADTVQLLSSGLRAVFGGRTRYEVRTNADGVTMTGSYGSGPTTRPFTLRRNSSDTEYRAANAPAVRFVTVAKDVQIEVLDWGGTGRPLVLLPGLGSSAHVFNTFAPT
ncbi:MAG: alpha/beta fold hydrolase, partial [Gemmatimonas sp.]